MSASAPPERNTISIMIIQVNIVGPAIDLGMDIMIFDLSCRAAGKYLRVLMNLNNSQLELWAERSEKLGKAGPVINKSPINVYSNYSNWLVLIYVVPGGELF